MKELGRAICPPLLWRSIAEVRHRFGTKPRAVFSGVYERFEAVTDQQPWARVGYHEACRGLLRECTDGAIPPAAATAHALLAFIINTLPIDRAPKVLDWAGGTGLRFWTTRPALSRRVEWHVVDSPSLAAISMEIMGASEELMFAETLPSPVSSSFDVVLVYSSLQYVEAQSELLASLASYQPRYIVMPRLMACSVASYVTCQNVHGFDTPCKVSSIDEIAGALADRGYSPILMIRDGLDLTSMFSDDVPDNLRVGKEWLFVFRGAS